MLVRDGKEHKQGFVDPSKQNPAKIRRELFCDICYVNNYVKKRYINNRRTAIQNILDFLDNNIFVNINYCINIIAR